MEIISVLILHKMNDSNILQKGYYPEYTSYYKGFNYVNYSSAATKIKTLFFIVPYYCICG